MNSNAPRFGGDVSAFSYSPSELFVLNYVFTQINVVFAREFAVSRTFLTQISTMIYEPKTY
jgi:hypothetical protein